MAKYYVSNLDSPIESDYWVDIPVRDPATNKDKVDDQGRIVVKRHVTRTVKQQEMQKVLDNVDKTEELNSDYSEFKELVQTKIDDFDYQVLENTNNITTLTNSVNSHDLQINALYGKINAIQGIDIDDFKLVTETDIKKIKESYMPLSGGTISGSLTVQKGITGTLTGSATSATYDNTGKKITDYICKISGSGNKITATLGNNTQTSVEINNVAHASVADSATNATNASNASYATNATNATKDSQGNQISSSYIRINAAQSISVVHNLTAGVKINGYLITVG